jgi:hypothetical protein
MALDGRSTDTVDVAESHTSGDARPGRLRRHRGLIVALIAAALLGQMVFGMVAAARAQSTTVDESVYVGTAVVYLQERSLKYNPEHPPLGKLIAAAGLVFTDARLDTSMSSQWLMGSSVLHENGNDAQRLLLFARIPMIVLTCLFGLVVFAFARDLTGPVGGLVALALYAFSPDVMAHGSLAALDVPAAGFVLTATWFLWRARGRPGRYLPLAGLAIGAAVATKTNVLIVLPLVALFAGLAVWRAAGDRRAAAGEPGRPTGAAARRLVLTGVAAAAGVMVLAIATVWATYLVVDPRLRWTPPPNLLTVGGLKGFVVNLLPFPAPFRDGMLYQFALEDRTYSGFLFGEVFEGPRWYYLPAALLVKTPLGALLLWAAGAVALIATRRLRPAAVYVLLPPAVLLVPAMLGARTLGVRYAIFVPMFLAVAAAAVTVLRWRWTPVLTGVLVAFVAVSSVRAYPFYLPYANEAFGGPARTYRHLHDSNVDWGQDLKRTADYLDRHYPGRPVWLVYKGRGSPEYYGIEASDPLKAPPAKVRGVLVVSGTRVATASGPLAKLIESSELVHTVGYSIMIYER